MKNLIQAAVVTLFAASTAQAQQAVQWRVQDGGNGHWYQALSAPTGISWEAASRLLKKSRDSAHSEKSADRSRANPPSCEEDPRASRRCGAA